MKIVLCGQKSFGKAALELLLEKKHEIALVVAPLHELEKLDSLRATAEDKKLTVIDKLTSDKMPTDVDLIVTAHSHAFLSRQCRLKSRLGAIGYHPSLLPLHRGRDAIYWTIRDRDKIAGGSVYWLNDVVDGGDIAASSWCFVLPDDTPSTLWKRELFPMGIKLLDHVIKEVSAGVIRAEPQNKELATFEPSITNLPRLYRPELLGLPLAPSIQNIYRTRAKL